jgi:hypothetical protein
MDGMTMTATNSMLYGMCYDRMLVLLGNDLMITMLDTMVPDALKKETIRWKCGGTVAMKRPDVSCSSWADLSAFDFENFGID